MAEPTVTGRRGLAAATLAVAALIAGCSSSVFGSDRTPTTPAAVSTSRTPTSTAVPATSTPAPGTTTAAPTAASSPPVTSPPPSQPGASPAVTTTFRVFTPIDGSGRLTVPVASTVSGSCLGGADTVTVQGPALRCMAGNGIYDPCFLLPRLYRPGARYVACIPNPWSKATVLKLTGGVPQSTPAPAQSSRPWALELADGQRCTFAADAGEQADGVQLEFPCGTGFAGLPDSQDTSTSAVATYEAQGGGPATQVPVRVIWTVAFDDPGE